MLAIVTDDLFGNLLEEARQKGGKPFGSPPLSELSLARLPSLLVSDRNGYILDFASLRQRLAFTLGIGLERKGDTHRGQV